MKFGSLYSYWGTEWKCDYPRILKKLRDCGYDVPELGAAHVLEMDVAKLTNIRRMKYLGAKLLSEPCIPIGPATLQIRINRGTGSLCEKYERSGNCGRAGGSYSVPGSSELL